MGFKGVIERVLAFGGRLPAHPYAEQFSANMDLPEQASAKEIFLIASTPRSGSHLLGHMLKEHGGFGVPLEYLHPGNLKYWRKRFGVAEPLEILSHLIRCRTSSNGRFVFKAHWDHFAPFVGREEELTGGVGIAKAVWIYRRSILAQAVSFCIARQTGVWISGGTPNGEASYNANGIIAAARTVRSQNAAWAKYFQQNSEIAVRAIAYEDLIRPLSSQKRELERFLGVESSLAPSAKTKTQAHSLNGEWKTRFLAEMRPEDQWIMNEQACPLASVLDVGVIRNAS